ncbi:MAG: DUF4255 domain-containing protein [Oscillochloris sp.]|nr:DUF4255 domain-containing protein [Oscillochloris sp.]
MIGDALVFLKQQLNDYMRLSLGHDGSQPDPVDFIDGEKMEPLTFRAGAVSLLLLNLEAENTLRAPDLYRRTSPNGVQQVVQPDIRLNLYVLFVARSVKYVDSLYALSLVIRYFQNHRVFTRPDSPALSESIERLVVELVTLPFAQQNEVWNALRVSYHPSVLYRVKMVVFQDEEALAAPELTEKVINTSL